MSKPRPYAIKRTALDSNTANTRETLVTPSKGKRIRLIRVRVIQETTDGREIWACYFGTGATITTNPAKAVDVLDIPNLGEASTRTWLKNEGPRGLRDEVLSGRWLSSPPPTTVHKIMVEYQEEA